KITPIDTYNGLFHRQQETARPQVTS
ncbi:MAG: hypothetical protein HW404_1175, partial [Anaerolineales bacterium]|nr:hypothetical protein [Anaerolineales bacterium]